MTDVSEHHSEEKGKSYYVKDGWIYLFVVRSAIGYD